jgi:hypothetical protein
MELNKQVFLRISWTDVMWRWGEKSKIRQHTRLLWLLWCKTIYEREKEDGQL